MALKDYIAPITIFFVLANLFVFYHYSQSTERRKSGKIALEWETFPKAISESRPPLSLATSFGASNRSWVVLTTDRDVPSNLVQTLSTKSADWRILVVGKRELSADNRQKWESLRVVTYLGPSAQRDMGARIAYHVPLGSKNFGFLFAIQHGAKHIVETEDGDEFFDHEILDDPQSVFLSPHPSEIAVYDTSELSRSDTPLLDPFRHFVVEGARGVRARGSTLKDKPEAKSLGLPTRKSTYCKKLLIQHSVQNGVPDHDWEKDERHTELWASLSKDKNHQDAYGSLPFSDSKPLVVPEGTFVPFNGRSTLYHTEALWATVSFEKTTSYMDIWKAFWAEKLIWALHSGVGFLRPMLTRIPNAEAKGRPPAPLASETGRELTGRVVSYLSKAQVDATLGFPRAAISLAEDIALNAGGWSTSDSDFLLSWFSDLRDAGYEFPQFFSTCNASKGADPNADASLYVVAKPIELLKAAFGAQNVYFCCGESSLSSWRHWIGNTTVPLIAPKITDLGTESSPAQGATIVLELSKISLSELKEALHRLSNAQTFVIYHSVRTFCPPGCEDEDGIEMMTQVAKIIEDFLTMQRSWTIDWEPLIPGEMKYPSPWILRREFTTPREIDAMNRITKRQFPEHCSAEELFWYLSYFLRVGPHGGFTYGINIVTGDLLSALGYENTVMDWSPREWESYFGKRNAMELDGRIVCTGSNVGCPLLPVTNCHPQDLNRTIDQWEPIMRGPIDRSPLANWTQRAQPPFDGRFALSWMYRLKKYFRDEIRKVVESIPIPSHWLSIHIRRGNKINEAQHTSIENYIETIDHYLPSLKANQIYVCTDSEVALRELTNFTDTYHFHVDWTQKRFLEDVSSPWRTYWLVPGQTTERTTYWNNRAVVGTLVDLWFMIHSEQHIGTSTSNVFTFVRSVRAGQRKASGVSLLHQGLLQRDVKQ